MTECRDTTARAMASKARRTAQTAAKFAAVKSSALWTDLSDAVASGMAQQMFGIGDMIDDVWTDTAASKEYSYQWHIADFQPITLQDGSTQPGMFVQAHWAHPFGVQFSHQRAFLACPDGLTAGTYYFTITTAWGGNVAANDVVCFTTTKTVPAGGRVAGCYGAPDVKKSSWKIYSYAADGRTLIETITPTFTAADGAVNLGKQALNKRTGNLNSTHEMAYGWNRWKTSALRQYLNSTAGVGEWWTPQDQWDIAPDQLATKAGFLSGCSADFLSAIKPVKVTTYANTCNDGGGADVTYDRVFLPALEQMYVTPQIAGEGTTLEYWKQRSGESAPLKQCGTYPKMITYAAENHTSAQLVRLRSAYRGNACDAWYVSASGYVGNSGASAAYRCAPLVVI